MRGVLAGAVGLLVLHALVARANQNQLSGLTKVATGFVTRFLDPTIPAIPDRGASSSSTSAKKSAPQVPTSTLKIAPVPVPNLWTTAAASSVPTPTAR